MTSKNVNNNSEHVFAGVFRRGFVVRGSVVEGKGCFVYGVQAVLRRVVSRACVVRWQRLSLWQYISTACRRCSVPHEASTLSDGLDAFYCSLAADTLGCVGHYGEHRRRTLLCHAVIPLLPLITYEQLSNSRNGGCS